VNGVTRAVREDRSLLMEHGRRGRPGGRRILGRGQARTGGLRRGLGSDRGGRGAGVRLMGAHGRPNGHQ
jgi:hypothetical protein